jgi:hypothetical protein
LTAGIYLIRLKLKNIFIRGHGITCPIIIIHLNKWRLPVITRILLSSLLFALSFFNNPAVSGNNNMNSPLTDNGSENSITDKKLSGNNSTEENSTWSLAGISLFKPVQYPDAESDIYGLRINLLYGVHRDIYGFDLGLVNKADNVYGFQTGIFYNNVSANMNGFQISVVNNVDGNTYVMQTALYSNNVKGSMMGVQTALIKNIVDGTMAGIETAILLNQVKGNMYGMQTALLSNKVSGNGAGFQFAISENAVNGNMYGFQTAAAFNGTGGTMAGFQTAFMLNGVHGNMYGFQTAIGCNFVVSEKKQSAGFGDIYNIYTDQAKGIHSLLGEKNADKGNMYGMQLSIINGVAGSMNGIQGALFYNASGDMSGIQFAGFYNYTSEDLNGFQISLAGNNTTGNVTGMQGSLFANYSGEMTGLQIACLNMQSFNNQESVSRGIQFGIINYSEAIEGVQIGLFNWSKRMAGVQIGLINIIQNNPVPVMVLINFSSRL